MTTTKTRGRPPKAQAEQTAVETPTEAPEKTNDPTLSLTLPDLKILVDALLRLPNSPENVDVYYKIETYRQELKAYLSK